MFDCRQLAALNVVQPNVLARKNAKVLVVRNAGIDILSSSMVCVSFTEQVGNLIVSIVCCMVK